MWKVDQSSQRFSNLTFCFKLLLFKLPFCVCLLKLTLSPKHPDLKLSWFFPISTKEKAATKANKWMREVAQWSLWGLGFVFWTSQRKLGSRDLKAGNKNIKDGVSRVSCCRQQHSAASAPCSICSFKANQTDQKKEKEARVGRKYLKINLIGSLFLRNDRSIYWSMLT